MYSLFPPRPDAHLTSKLKHKHGGGGGDGGGGGGGGGAGGGGGGGGAGAGGSVQDAIATDLELRLLESLPPDVPLPPRCGPLQPMATESTIFHSIFSVCVCVCVCV